MMDGERVWAVKRLLFDYVKSPSLRHIRDQHSVSKLAQEIVQTLDQGNDPIWTKWDKQRDIVAKAALGCWAPNEDLRDFLNRMPGPKLTTTDVAQRLKILEAESYEYPNEELQAGCLVLYEKEKAAQDVEPVSSEFAGGRRERSIDRQVPSARRCDQGRGRDGISTRAKVVTYSVSGVWRTEPTPSRPGAPQAECAQ